MSEQADRKSLILAVDNMSKSQTVASAQAQDLAAGAVLDLDDSSYYVNREVNYFKFNLRVLSQASNPKHPLLERLMFLLIFSSNLDEFFEIRISGLKKQLDFGRQRP